MNGDIPSMLRGAEPALLRLAWLLTGDREAAQDLTQETFVRAWGVQRKLLTVEQPRAYLRMIMVNLARREGRRRRDEALTVAHDHAAPGDHATDIATTDAVSRALDSLPAGQRTAVVLRYYEQLTEAETAHLMGCSVGNVKSQTSRGVAALRNHMTANEERST